MEKRCRAETPGYDRENAECLDTVSSPPSLLKAARPALRPLAGQAAWQLHGEELALARQGKGGIPSNPLSLSVPSAHSAGSCQGEPQFRQMKGNAHGMWL